MAARESLLNCERFSLDGETRLPDAEMRFRDGEGQLRHSRTRQDREMSLRYAETPLQDGQMVMRNGASRSEAKTGLRMKESCSPPLGKGPGMRAYDEDLNRC